MISQEARKRLLEQALARTIPHLANGCDSKKTQVTRDTGSKCRRRPSQLRGILQSCCGMTETSRSNITSQENLAILSST